MSCFDVVATSHFVANISHSKLPTILAKQHHIVGGAKFGYDSDSRFGHFKMVMLGPVNGCYCNRFTHPSIPMVMH
jgi:hypothetical protein